MSWQVMNYEDLPADLRALDQQRQVLANITIAMFDEGTAPSKMTLDVPATSALRGREWQSRSMRDIAARLADTIRSAVETSVHLLVVNPGRLAPAGGAERIGTLPVLDVRLILHEMDPSKAEVGVSMPDPAPFRRAMAQTGSLAEVMDGAVRRLDREVRTFLATELVERKVLFQ